MLFTGPISPYFIVVTALIYVFPFFSNCLEKMEKPLYKSAYKLYLPSQDPTCGIGMLLLFFDCLDEFGILEDVKVKSVIH